MRSFREYCTLREAEREFDDFDIGPQSDEHTPDEDEQDFSRSPERPGNSARRWIDEKEATEYIGHPGMIAKVKQGHLAPVEHEGRRWNIGFVQGDWYMEPDTSTAGL